LVDRKVSLFYHPDKNALNDMEKSTGTFKAIQLAYDTLMDQKTRETYDSTIPFDDSIPNPNLDADFFELYRPVFERNAIFSSVQPVPELGNADTPFEVVDKFYDFWFGFKSWREFPDEEEYNLEEAECREEKRWMERQNAKIQQAAKRAEAARIRDLVEQAMSKDPRVLKEKEEQKRKEKEAKLAKKQAREDVKRQKIEEEQKKLEEIRRKEEEKLAEENAKKDEVKKKKEAIKRFQKKIRRKLNLWAADYKQIDEEFIKNYVSSIPNDQLEVVAEKMESGIITVESVLEAANIEIKVESKEEKEPEVEKTPVAVPLESLNNDVNRPSENMWTSEELALLTKGIKRYPGGTQDRWEKVSAFVRSKTVVQVIQKVKELKKSAKTSTADSMSKSEDRAEEKQASVAEEKSGNSSEKQDQVTEDWTPKQQQQLEFALRHVFKDHPDRWEEIAKIVQGKTKKDCIKRFKEIRAAMSK
jgi:DnaJ family protein C protein 2